MAEMLTCSHRGTRDQGRVDEINMEKEYEDRRLIIRLYGNPLICCAIIDKVLLLRFQVNDFACDRGKKSDSIVRPP